MTQFCLTLISSIFVAIVWCEGNKSSFDLAVVGITTECQKTSRMIQRDLEEEEEDGLPRVVPWERSHRLFCIDKSSSHTEDESLLSIILTLLLDPEFYIVDKPDFIYHFPSLDEMLYYSSNKNIKIVGDWRKQTSVFSIYTFLPDNLLKLLLETISFTKIPVTVNDPAQIAVSPNYEWVYDTVYKSNILQQAAEGDIWNEIIIIQLTGRDSVEILDDYFVQQIIKDFNKGPGHCIKFTKIHYSDEIKMDRTIEKLNSNGDHKQMVILTGDWEETMKVFLDKLNSKGLGNSIVFAFKSDSDLDLDYFPENTYTFLIESYVRHEVNMAAKGMNNHTIEEIFEPIFIFLEIAKLNYFILEFRKCYIGRMSSLIRIHCDDVSDESDYKTSFNITITNSISNIHDTFVDEFEYGRQTSHLGNFNHYSQIENIIYTECSVEVCKPGFYKMFSKFFPPLSTWDWEYGHKCLPCLNNTIKPKSGDDKCNPCEGYLIANDQKTECLDPFTSVFWATKTTSGIIAMTISVIGVLSTAMVMVVFFCKRHTPIVKVSDRQLALVHLVAIMFVCCVLPLTYFAKPSFINCASRTLTIAVFYNLNISIVLVKSNKLVKAFLAKTRATENEVLKTSLTQAFVALVNLLVGVSLSIALIYQIAPAPEHLLNFDNYKRLVSCNNNLHTNIIIGFMICLQLCCIFQAFRCRNLPGYLNESMSITYASFITTVSFLVMYPIQYFQKNSQDAAKVQLLTVLGNSVLFLLFVYGKKTCLILFKPDYNTTSYFRRKQMQAMEMCARELR